MCFLSRLHPSSLSQGGDFIFENGSGGEVSPAFTSCAVVFMLLPQSIWGGTFKDEKAGLQQKFTDRGVVSASNPTLPASVL